MSHMAALAAVMRGAQHFSVPQIDIYLDSEIEGVDIWDFEYEVLETNFDNFKQDSDDSDSQKGQEEPTLEPDLFNTKYVTTTQPEQKSDQNSEVIRPELLGQTHTVKEVDIWDKMLITASHIIQPYNLHWQNTKISISIGVPQGGKTSPLFFVLLRENAIRSFEVRYNYKIRKKIKVYADDIAFKFDPGNNVDDLKQKIRDHFKDYGLIINDDKFIDISAQKFDFINLTQYKKKFRYLGLNISQHPIKIFEEVIQDDHSEQKTSYLNRFKSYGYLYQRIYKQYIFAIVQTKLYPILASAKSYHVQEMIELYKKGAVAFIQRGDSFLRQTKTFLKTLPSQQICSLYRQYNKNITRSSQMSNIFLTTGLENMK